MSEPLTRLDRARLAHYYADMVAYAADGSLSEPERDYAAGEAARLARALGVPFSRPAVVQLAFSGFSDLAWDQAGAGCATKSGTRSA